MGHRFRPDEQPVPDGMAPEVTLGRDGILRIDYSRYDRITLASIEHAHALHVALCPNRRIPALFQGKGVGSVERHLARMFLIYHRPPYPVQVFSDEANALAWLRGFLPSA
jgi:hypothetical protein